MVTSQFAGFMNPLVKCSMNAHKIKEFSEEEFNVNSDTYFFLGESHENNRKKPVGVTARNGTMYNRVGIVSDPVEKYTDDGICSIKTEKKSRDACFNILSKSCKKISVGRGFICSLDESHSLTAKTLEEFCTWLVLDPGGSICYIWRD